MSLLTPISTDEMPRLHRRTIEDPTTIRLVLETLAEKGVVLGNGIDDRNQPRVAQVSWIRFDRLAISARNIKPNPGRQLYFNFELDKIRYFFASTVLNGRKKQSIEIAIPSAIYEAERRDLQRMIPTHDTTAPRVVELDLGSSKRFSAPVRDCSYQGLAIALPPELTPEIGEEFAFKFLDGADAGEQAYATVRHRTKDGEQQGWLRLGLSVTQIQNDQVLPVERRESILTDSGLSRAWQRIAIVSGSARVASSRLRRRLGLRESPRRVNVVEYPNDRGEPIRAIINSTGRTKGATAVIIPPAWGRTKETVLPLAATLVRTFEDAGEPLIVLRFDGTHRRGESFIHPDCRKQGDEYLRFKFSQAVRDIHASVDFLARTPEFMPARLILVTFSLASVEGRRAVATDPESRFDGWISAVGMVDLQSGLRSVSGGVDYAYGLRCGVTFGIHELVGVRANMDHTGKDALDNRLVYFEDARRDMARIDIPITWLHGRHDAWMDLTRIRQLLSAGDSSERRLIEIPTGHQLRTSAEALETFQLISQEVGKMALGREIRSSLPDLVFLEREVQMERARRPKLQVDLHEFWTDYLLGRDRHLGIELMTATTAYSDLMRRQIDLLEIKEGDRIIDLGSGTGTLPLALASEGDCPKEIEIVGIDFVREAIKRSRSRMREHRVPPSIRAWNVAGNLELTRGEQIPLRESCADRVLASLVISYLERPLDFLTECRRLLRRQGRLVVSTLRRDADISRIYVDGIADLPPVRVRELFGVDGEKDFGLLQRRFLNDASRLLDLEEGGRFRFWDPDELAALARRAGFRGVRTEMAFGDPPQAVLMTAVRE